MFDSDHVLAYAVKYISSKTFADAALREASPNLNQTLIYYSHSRSLPSNFVS